MADEPTFWQAAWLWMKRVFRWVAAPLPAILVVCVAVALIVLGVKGIQVGGILDWLLGRKKTTQKAIDVANSVPDGRIDKDGKLIPPGTPDSQGMTQAVVVPIKPPNVFSNPNTVEVQLPGEDKPTHIELPDGVKANDVDKVVVVKPDVVAVTVKDGSGVNAQSIDNLLAKYGK